MGRVGIIMPTHGTNQHLTAAVGSVAAQTFRDWTLIIVCDGASGENQRVAEQLAGADARVRVVCQPRAGVAAARNRGLAELDPDVELVALLDHDDRWLPDALQTLTAVLAGSGAAVIGAHGISRRIDAEGKLVDPGRMESNLRRRLGVEEGRVVKWPLSRPTSFANLALGNCIPVGTAVVRRAAFARVGKFDERAVPADDYDMWLRLARCGDFAFVDQVVMEYRQHAVPTWIRPRGVGRGAPYVRRKIIASNENTPRQAAQARAGYRICERWIVSHALDEARRLGGRGRMAAAARQLLRAGLHFGRYVRGRPGWWHR